MRIRSHLHLSAMPRRRLWVIAAITALFLSSPAFAQPGAAAVDKLNKQALEAYDGLSFDQAKTLLEQALQEAQSAGLANAPVTARTHLNLGMVLIASLQETQGPARGVQRDEAVSHFKAALKIRPDLVPPAGLFNPEVQAVFDETKHRVEAERASDPPPPPPKTAHASPRAKPPEDADPADAPPSKRVAGRAIDAEGDGEGEGGSTDDSDHEDIGGAGGSASRIFLSIGFGSGLGVAKGKLDANKDIMQGGKRDNSWSGGLSPSGLGHLLLGVGYFASRDLLLSVEGRIQIVSGTTTVATEPSCTPSCSPPSTGIAVLGKAGWFLAPGPLRPYVSAGVGAGAIRQVVKVDIPPTASDPTTHCGEGGNKQCVDTVTGGPFLLAVGGGVVYDMGSFALMGSVTANVGVPKLMLNIDAVLGLGLRL